MQSDVKSVTAMERNAEAPMFQKRIGTTVYRVSVHFSQTSSETVEDKILRLIKSVPQGEQAAGKRES